MGHCTDWRSCISSIFLYVPGGEAKAVLARTERAAKKTEDRIVGGVSAKTGKTDI